jgi:hypothetical protein
MQHHDVIRATMPEISEISGSCDGPCAADGPPPCGGGDGGNPPG